MKPNIQPDGSCLTCIFHYTECEHHAENAKAYDRKWREVGLAAQGLRRAEIDRICGRYELESDEFMTSNPCRE